MQLTCPECGEAIMSENINAQEMFAVCSVCNTVFPFDLPETKAKRRKVKKPRQLMLRDAQTLHMAFRTNFRLDRDEAFISSGVMSLVFTLVTLVFTNEYLIGDRSLLMPLIFGALVFVFYYVLALLLYNKTHIDMDADSIQVSRQPLPTLNRTQNINLSGVVAIHCEETPISIKEGYDTPRYRVWAELAGGSCKTIVTDVIDDYGFFIAQRLQERLHHDTHLDVSRLEDFEPHTHSEEDSSAAVPSSQKMSQA